MHDACTYTARKRKEKREEKRRKKRSRKNRKCIICLYSMWTDYDHAVNDSGQHRGDDLSDSLIML